MTAARRHADDDIEYHFTAPGADHVLSPPYEVEGINCIAHGKRPAAIEFEARRCRFVVSFDTSGVPRLYADASGLLFTGEGKRAGNGRLVDARTRR